MFGGYRQTTAEEQHLNPRDIHETQDGTVN
jgi:hypothetical protein